MDSTTVLPSLTTAEEDIIGAVLTDRKYYDEVKRYIYTPDVFYNELNRDVWIAIEKQISNQETPTLIQTVDMVNKGKWKEHGVAYLVSG